MGDSTSWIAVRGKASELIRHELGLELLSEKEFSPVSLLAASTGQGWYVIQSRLDFAQNERLIYVSRDCEAVACAFDTHVMFSGASSWRNGVPSWAVTHDEQRNPFDLTTVGNLPEEFADIRDRMVLKQKVAHETGKKVDHVFDVPILLAESLTGFRQHGQDAPDFHLLVPISGSSITMTKHSVATMPLFEQVLATGEKAFRSLWRRLKN